MAINMLDRVDDRPPIFVGAGVIKSEERIRYFAGEPLLRAQVIGSFSDTEWGGTDSSGEKNVFWWDEENQAAYNAFGLRNCGRKAASEFLPDSIKAVKDAGQLAVVSVTALASENPVRVLPDLAEWAFDMGADRVEVNGSCPNQELHSLLCENTDKTAESIEAIRARVGSDQYLQLKVSALDRQTIRRYCTDYRLAINGVAAINNCRRLSPINPATNRPSIEVNEGFAGQSGPIICDLARTNLEMWLQEEGYRREGGFGELYDVWSIGGVDSGKEVFEREQLGASMIGGAQAFYRAQKPYGVVQRWVREYNEAKLAA